MNTPNDPKGAAGALKTPLGLIPSYAMEQTALVHKLGSEKYGPYNWRKTGVFASTYFNAILRHLNAWRDGETVDPESDIPHLAHIACSCNILLDAGFCGALQDDRIITPPNTPARKMDRPGPVSYTEYRLLEEGEIVQDGDEYYYSFTDDWLPTAFIIDDLYTVPKVGLYYRRKVETPAPDTEYYYLKPDDIIQNGDEWYDDDDESNGLKGWKKTGYTTGETSVGEAGLLYRRKVGTKNEPEECSCGRYKIRHFTLGLICEDCDLQWQDPY